MPSNTTLVLRYNTNFMLNQCDKTNYLQVPIQNKLKKKIYCKNFFFLILILEFLQSYNIKSNLNDQQTQGVCIKHKIVCNTVKKQTLTYLRAPNRAKSSQVSLNLPRYVVTLKICFIGALPTKFILNPMVITNYFLILQKQFNFFESNLLNLMSLKVFLKYSYKGKKL